MPKVKTHKGAAKRFRVTANGHIKRTRNYKNHIATHKSGARVRNLRKGAYVSEQEEKNILTLIPYK